MHTSILFSWIGHHDLGNCKNNMDGPLATLCKQNYHFDKVVLFFDPSHYTKDDASDFKEWFSKFGSFKVELYSSEISFKPIALDKIFAFINPVLSIYANQATTAFFNLTSGTPAMAAAWVLSGFSQPFKDAHFLQSDFNNEILDLPKLDLYKYAHDLDLALSSVSLFSEIIGTSTPILDIKDKVSYYANFDCNILITGETGVGKGVFAKAIHNASARNNRKMVTINCGAIPTELLESELFGSVKGAYNGAVTKDGHFKRADKSTLFLDEIGDLSLSHQVKVLRAIQEKIIAPVGGAELPPIDVRIIAATNKDLKKAVQEGRFREDLFHRLNELSIDIPPLRERREDIPLLIEYFESQLSLENRKLLPAQLSAEIIDFLSSCPWPGNVRALENAIRKIYIESARRSRPLTKEEIVSDILASYSDTDYTRLHDGQSFVLDVPFDDDFCMKKQQARLFLYYLRQAKAVAPDAGIASLSRLLRFKSANALRSGIKSAEAILDSEE